MDNREAPQDPNENRKKKFLWHFYLQIIAGLFMLVGIVLSFFYIHYGGLFVGLGAGIAFFDEVQNYFLNLRGFYVEAGIFKTLMLIGVVIYFLIAIPVFVVAFAVGFGFIYMIYWTTKALK